MLPRGICPLTTSRWSLLEIPSLRLSTCSFFLSSATSHSPLPTSGDSASRNGHRDGVLVVSDGIACQAITCWSLLGSFSIRKYDLDGLTSACSSCRSRRVQSTLEWCNTSRIDIVGKRAVATLDSQAFQKLLVKQRSIGYPKEPIFWDKTEEWDRVKWVLVQPRLLSEVDGGISLWWLSIRRDGGHSSAQKQ